MATTFKPPTPFHWENKISIFLGGSIEMGKAEDWQTAFGNKLKDLDIIILNPRRDEWDSSWEQNKANPPFREQVEWELAAMEQANLIVFYFAPNTKSPITLMELGLWAQSGKCLVLCPEGFWRKGNVDIVCERYQAQQFQTWDELEQHIRLYYKNSFNI